MRTAYRTSDLWFEKKPHIQPAPMGVRASAGLFCVCGQAKSANKDTVKTYYLHQEQNGAIFWYRELRKHGGFASREEAEAALASVIGEISLCR